MKDEDRSKISGLIVNFRDGVLTTEAFCNAFEEFVNFELDFDAVDDNSKSAINELFDVVTWYSPFRDDRKDYKGFRTEAEVRKSTERLAPSIVGSKSEGL